MFREFNLKDLDKFEPNKLSDYEDYKEIFYAEQAFKYVYSKGQKVLAIIIFMPYWENNWCFFVLFSKDFKAAYLRDLKNFFELCIEKIRPDRLVTDSVDIDFNNKLHKLFGFNLEGTRRRHMYGQDINMWGRIWE